MKLPLPRALSKKNLPKPAPNNLATRILLGVLVCAFSGWLIYQIRDILTSVLIAFMLAYILSPLVDRLERLGTKRSRAVVLLLLLVTLTLVLFFLFVIPLITTQIADFLNLLPDKLLRLYAWLDVTLSGRFNISLPKSGSEAFDQLRFWLSKNQSTILSPLAGVVQHTFTNTIAFVLALLNLFLIPLLTIYLLMDFKKIRQQLIELVPRRYAQKFEAYAAEFDAIMASFFRGQITLVCILAIFYIFGFIWVEVPMAVLVGLISAIGHFIPYVGPITATILGLTFILADLNSWWQIGQFFFVIATVQGLESFVLTPRLVGKRLGLSPVVTIISLLIFGKILGFLGLLLAIPLAALSKILLGDLIEKYRNSAYYQKDLR
jgi:predicted PurR-regulated permease PerM